MVKEYIECRDKTEKIFLFYLRDITFEIREELLEYNEWRDEVANAQGVETDTAGEEAEKEEKEEEKEDDEE